MPASEAHARLQGDRTNYRFLGQLSYAAGLEAQAEAVREVQSGAPNVLLGLTHDPVITLGRHATMQHLLADSGIPIVKTDRGGDITYHGPEQVLVYPIVRLTSGVKPFVRALEEAMIRYLATLGISALARDDAPGVYVDGAKIGLLGLRVHEGISRHGLALNLGGSLAAFATMNPCGHAGQRLTSVELLTGTRPSHATAAAAIAREVERLLSI